ncbi:SOS response-associated peptidase [Fundidesulfovibrio putealis]|uniref:SOS response-associated peptidase n=1 Tax=Fundidesulfovibrio putealis TaxID=270496 RepID=UPI000406C62E|nr:SOS response-associated peptidase [Fundidesulfovibrio putealis]
MCGRFALGIPRKRLQERFELAEVPQAPARYNIAPGQLVEAVVQTPERREMRLLKWGLIPSWAKDKSIGYKMINARAETVAEKPSFKTAMRRRRCLIPAQGFYEWHDENGHRQPWFITSRNPEDVLALAGIWEHYESQEGEIIESVAIITCQANELVSPLHDRMPVIVVPKDDARWLDPKQSDPAQVADILTSRPWPGMLAYRVSTRVNSPKNDDSGLIEMMSGQQDDVPEN